MAKTFEMTDPNEPGSKFDIPAEEVKRAMKDGLTLNSRLDKFQATVYGPESFANNDRIRANFDAEEKSAGKTHLSDEELMNLGLNFGAGGATRGGAGKAASVVTPPPPSAAMPAGDKLLEELMKAGGTAKRQIVWHMVKKALKAAGVFGAGAGTDRYFNGD